jgi:hypothetical protein
LDAFENGQNWLRMAKPFTKAGHEKQLQHTSQHDGSSAYYIADQYMQLAIYRGQRT